MKKFWIRMINVCVIVAALIGYSKVTLAHEQTDAAAKAEADRKNAEIAPYFLKYACGRPQILQRLYSLVENFGARCCLIFIDVLAMNFPPLLCEWHIELSQ